MWVQRLIFAATIGPELRLWTRAGHSPRFWWRDDDAREPSLALTRLLDLSKRHNAPLTLAAVPDGDMAALSTLVGKAGAVEIAIHGFRHENRAPPGQPSGEVTDADSLEQVSGQIAAIKARFNAAGIAPGLFVPPWNNLHPTLERAVEMQDLHLSCHGQMRQPIQPPVRIDTHLDLMRWKPAPRFRGTARLALRLRRLLAMRRRQGAWSQPIGLLTHHLDHDAATWQCLDHLLARFKVSSRVDCL